MLRNVLEGQVSVVVVAAQWCPWLPKDNTADLTCHISNNFYVRAAACEQQSFAFLTQVQFRVLEKFIAKSQILRPEDITRSSNFFPTTDAVHMC